MAVTVRGTDIVFNDGSTQSTAAVGNLTSAIANTITAGGSTSDEYDNYRGTINTTSTGYVTARTVYFRGKNGSTVNFRIKTTGSSDGKSEGGGYARLLVDGVQILEVYSPNTGVVLSSQVARTVNNNSSIVLQIRSQNGLPVSGGLCGILPAISTGPISIALFIY